MVEFEVVMRGYDRSVVDALVRAVEAAAGDQQRITASLTEIGPPPAVLRGYHPAQVDAWLARCRAGELGKGSTPRPGTPGTEIRIVLRGYRVAETDALLATVGAAIEGPDPFRRAEALRAIADVRLPVGLRGYDRGQIDAYLKQATQTLRATATPSQTTNTAHHQER